MAATINPADAGLAANVTNLLGSFFANVLPSQYTLPQPNLLSGFASYSCIFGLHCLDADSHNYPDSSYLAGIFPPIIAKSANTNPDNRFSIGGLKQNFYIDDVAIVSYPAFTEKTNNTNTTSVEFTITEPYSIGGFWSVLQAAALNAGYKNYVDACYLLTVQFRGNTETGLLQNIPGIAKYIPIKIVQSDMKVNAAGSIYTFSCMSYASHALDDSYKRLKTQATISGKTVAEILQYGPNSLQYNVNQELIQQKLAGATKIADEILILFPKDWSTKGMTGQSLAPGLSSTTATTNTSVVVDNPKLQQRLGVTRSTPTRLLQQAVADINAIGAASIGFDAYRAGRRPMGTIDKAWDAKQQTYVQGNSGSDPNAMQFTFAQGSDIINAINQVILKSAVAYLALDPSQVNPSNGMRPWWRIDTQVYHSSSADNIKLSGVCPKLIVYRVIPYMYHASRLLAPNTPAPGTSGLTKQVVKVYNYLYTGLNTEVRNFDIHFENALFQAFMSDNFQRNADKVSQANQGFISSSAQAKRTGIQQPIGTGEPTISDLPNSAKNTAINTKTIKHNTGGAGETDSTLAARVMYDALMSSKDMIEANIVVNGDPYYITNSGTGNYTAQSTSQINITADGDINYQNGEVHVILNFRTPVDIDQTTGLYKSKSVLAAQFSGLYRVISIESKFSKGDFVQSLQCNRVPNQLTVGSTQSSASGDGLLTSQQALDPNGYNGPDGTSAGS